MPADIHWSVEPVLSWIMIFSQANDFLQAIIPAQPLAVYKNCEFSHFVALAAHISNTYSRTQLNLGEFDIPYGRKL